MKNQRCTNCNYVHPADDQLCPKCGYMKEFAEDWDIAREQGVKNQSQPIKKPKP